MRRLKANHSNSPVVVSQVPEMEVCQTHSQSYVGLLIHTLWYIYNYVPHWIPFPSNLLCGVVIVPSCQPRCLLRIKISVQTRFTFKWNGRPLNTPHLGSGADTDKSMRWSHHSFGGKFIKKIVYLFHIYSREKPFLCYWTGVQKEKKHSKDFWSQNRWMTSGLLESK